jgi:hypothetical protein
MTFCKERTFFEVFSMFWISYVSPELVQGECSRAGQSSGSRRALLQTFTATATEFAVKAER